MHFSIVQRKIIRLSFLTALGLVILMWLVFLVDSQFQLNLYKFGNHPLHVDGLTGILFSPLIHSATDPGHILNNTMPTLVLTWMLFYHYRIIATKSLVIIWLVSGLGLWLLGRETFHIGMSGVIYGLSAFLTFSGFFRKNLRVAGVSLLVIFLYGSMVWGIFPIKEQISWEGHAAGLFTGIIVALIFRKSPPQAVKMQYEIEEEMGIEPGEFWKDNPDANETQTTNQPQNSQEEKME